MQQLDAIFLLIVTLHAIIFLERDARWPVTSHLLGRLVLAGLGMLAFCMAMDRLSEPTAPDMDFWVHLGLHAFTAAFLAVLAWRPKAAAGMDNTHLV